jgi:hypothetical protein
MHKTTDKEENEQETVHDTGLQPAVRQIELRGQGPHF